jgi:hypothetical protein
MLIMNQLLNQCLLQWDLYTVTASCCKMLIELSCFLTTLLESVGTKVKSTRTIWQKYFTGENNLCLLLLIGALGTTRQQLVDTVLENTDNTLLGYR